VISVRESVAYFAVEDTLVSATRTQPLVGADALRDVMRRR